MLQLTKRTEYGLIALTVLAAREGQVVSVREIAERYPLPRRLLAEALKDLCRADLIESQRGAQGGYTLTRKADSVTVGDIVSALEGAPSMTSCASLGAASSSPPIDSEVLESFIMPPAVQKSRANTIRLTVSVTAISTKV